MRRLTVLFVAVIVVLLGAYAGAAGPPAGPQAVELAPGVYAFIGVDGGTNSGFVVTGDGVVVIDSQGPRELALALKQAIAGVTDLPVIYVINTHYHGDHTFGNQYFSEGSRAIVAHEETRGALIERDHGHRTRFKRFFGEESLMGFNPVLPDVTFTERMTIRAGGRTLVLVHPGGPAHTFGDAYVALPDEGIVFAGDLLYNGRLPLLGDGDTAGAVAALDDLLHSGARTFVPGHGAVGGSDVVLAYRGYLLTLRAEVQRLGSNGRTAEQVKEEIKLPQFKGWLKYDHWLSQNAGAVYTELFGDPAPASDR